MATCNKYSLVSQCFVAFALQVAGKIKYPLNKLFLRTLIEVLISVMSGWSVVPESKFLRSRKIALLQVDADNCLFTKCRVQNWNRFYMHFIKGSYLVLTCKFQLRRHQDHEAFQIRLKWNSKRYWHYPQTHDETAKICTKGFAAQCYRILPYSIHWHIMVYRGN